MSQVNSASLPNSPALSSQGDALVTIAVGGLTAGTIDLLQACILLGGKIPLVIAAGLLGRQAVHGGTGTYAVGVILHFFIACSAASIYYAFSRRLTFMKEHWIVCGLFFGGAVEEVMNLVVLPLSALHARGPYELHDLILGLVVRMVGIGFANRIQRPSIVGLACGWPRAPRAPCVLAFGLPLCPVSIFALFNLCVLWRPFFAIFAVRIFSLTAPHCSPQPLSPVKLASTRFTN